MTTEVFKEKAQDSLRHPLTVGSVMAIVVAWVLTVRVEARLMDTLEDHIESPRHEAAETVINHNRDIDRIENTQEENMRWLKQGFVDVNKKLDELLREIHTHRHNNQ